VAPAELQAVAPEYVLIAPHALEWNYGARATGELINWVEQNGHPVFAFEGREHKRLVLYRLAWGDR
jgi:hypothetical protein